MMGSRGHGISAALLVTFLLLLGALIGSSKGAADGPVGRELVDSPLTVTTAMLLESGLPQNSARSGILGSIEEAEAQ